MFHHLSCVYVRHVFQPTSRASDKKHHVMYLSASLTYFPTVLDITMLSWFPSLERENKKYMKTQISVVMCKGPYCGKKQRWVNVIMYYVIQMSFETCMQSAYNHKVILYTYCWFENKFSFSIHVYLMSCFNDLFLWPQTRLDLLMVS